MFENLFANSGELSGLAANLFAIIAPVFIGAAIGYGWARRGMPFDNEFTTSLTSNIAFPCLIVATLARLEIDPDAFSRIALAGLITVTATAAVAASILKLAGQSQPVYLPSLVFGNVGNIGLPLCLFAFGEEGLALAIVFMTVFMVIQFTFGIWVSAGRGSIAILLRTPLVWAALIGITLQMLDIHLAIWIENTMGLIGDLAIPLMLLTLGVSLAKLKVARLGRSVALSVGRLAIGLAVGLAVAELLGMEGVSRGVLILESTMPVAVLNYLFAARYDRSPEEIAGLVLVSTAISFITLPGLLLLVL
jgi:predicted permease